ncbi:MAG: fluoride efflux transporter CrcB [Myxococcales bacterium]|nr:fluoride efflux transporter CrcB [Myxococcales bacterium]
MTIWGILAIAVFGAMGAVARFLVGGVLHRWLGFGFPFGTLAVNIIGSILLGALYAAGVEKNILPDGLKLPLMVGFIGSFTTFSTFSQEVFLFAESGTLGIAMIYVFVSLLTGIGGFACAVYAVRFCGL